MGEFGAAPATDAPAGVGTGVRALLVVDAAVLGMGAAVWSPVFRGDPTWGSPVAPAAAPLVLELGLLVGATLLLCGAVAPARAGEHTAVAGRIAFAALVLLAALSAFVLDLGRLWNAGVRPADSPAWGAYSRLVGLHAAHVVLALLIHGALLVRAIRPGLDGARHRPLVHAAAFLRLLTVAWVLDLALVFVLR